ncbi:MAG TPA: hypothetical protein VFE82_03485 [Ramlibacter sp.]|uniref:hypothetical protein n=1 Tax=Ramlibacter sp. TaxID=1917967 RepID=UPI002D4E1DF4|nr:hypothetical protein [Ramlibacter sp.]HZY17514.1 hypothetical protein [Ramlibacter sp.]
MKPTLSQNCPLCGAGAVFYFVDYEERKYFKCPHCGKFLVTRRAEPKLAEAPAGWRERFSELAKNPEEGYVLDISVLPPAADGSERTSEELTPEYLRKSDLSL